MQFKKVRSCICTPNIRWACSCVFTGRSSRDKDGADKPCVHQITGFVYGGSVCVYLTSLRSPWLWELPPPLVRYCRNWRWRTFLLVTAFRGLLRNVAQCERTCLTALHARWDVLKHFLIQVGCRHIRDVLGWFCTDTVNFMWGISL